MLRKTAGLVLLVLIAPLVALQWKLMHVLGTDEGRNVEARGCVQFEAFVASAGLDMEG